MDYNSPSYAAQFNDTSPAPQVPSVDESLAVAHEACLQAEQTLAAIWADLTGQEPGCAPDRSCSGVPIQPSAASLVDRAQWIANTVESIRRRISAGNPVQGIPQANRSATRPA